MAVKGTKKQENSFSKTYGLAAYEVLGVNLSNQELSELGFSIKEEDLEKEREFVKEKDGVDVVMLEFAVRSVGNNARLRRFSFFLENKNARNKEESEKGDLYQFINEQGNVAWSKKPNTYEPLNPQYAEYFTGRENAYNPRPAKVGEEQFMNFMRNCMAIDYKSGGTISYNLKKVFGGNFKEIAGDLQTDFLSTILVATTIKIKETEDGIKEVESFYPYAFAPGSYYKSVAQKGTYTDEDVLTIHEKIRNNKEKVGKKQWVNPLEQLIAKITDPNYPCKELFHLGVVKDYVSTAHIETSNDAIVPDVEEAQEEDNTSKY